MCEILDWCRPRNLFANRLLIVKTNEYSSSSSSSSSRRRWSDWTLEVEGSSTVRIWEFSTLVWWHVEEQNGRRRRQQEKISILYWPVRTINSLLPSSSRSFRTQSHWSLLPDNVLMPNDFFEYICHVGCAINFTLHKFRIDTGRTKIGQKTDGILHVCGSNGSRTLWSWYNHHVLHGTSRKKEKTSRHSVWGRYTVCSTEVLSSIKLERTQSSFTTHSQLIVSRKFIYENVYVSPRPPSKISQKHDWMKELGSEVVGSSKDKNGETRRWTRIHTKLRVDALKLKKKIKQERVDP